MKDVKSNMSLKDVKDSLKEDCLNRVKLLKYNKKIITNVIHKI